jgi:hypothetical protein
MYNQAHGAEYETKPSQIIRAERTFPDLDTWVALVNQTLLSEEKVQQALLAGTFIEEKDALQALVHIDNVLASYDAIHVLLPAKENAPKFTHAVTLSRALFGIAVCDIFENEDTQGVSLKDKWLAMIENPHLVDEVKINLSLRRDVHNADDIVARAMIAVTDEHTASVLPGLVSSADKSTHDRYTTLHLLNSLINRIGFSSSPSISQTMHQGFSTGIYAAYSMGQECRKKLEEHFSFDLDPADARFDHVANTIAKKLRHEYEIPDGIMPGEKFLQRAAHAFRLQAYAITNNSFPLASEYMGFHLRDFTKFTHERRDSDIFLAHELALEEVKGAEGNRSYRLRTKQVEHNGLFHPIYHKRFATEQYPTPRNRCPGGNWAVSTNDVNDHTYMVEAHQYRVGDYTVNNVAQFVFHATTALLKSYYEHISEKA